MTDDQIQSKPSDLTPRARQFSLQELFFATTLVALVMGLYMNVSQLLVLVLGSLVFVTGTIKFFKPTQALVGGLLGFVLATAASWVVFLSGMGDMSMRFAILVMLPTTGYLIGLIMIEMDNSKL